MEWDIKVREGGKMTIPIELRRALNLQEGSGIIVKLEPGKMTFVSPKIMPEKLRILQENYNQRKDRIKL